MASNYPTSLDTFTNPTSNDSLNSPSHSLQHADVNDAIEAIEAKLGIGASPAGSATAGYVLTAGTGGTTTWSALPDSGGLIQIVPTSIVKGASGSASVSAGGAVTFSGTESISLNGVFSSTYLAYKIVASLSAPSADNFFRIRLRASGTDSSASYFGTKISINDSGTTATYNDNNAASLGVFSMDAPNSDTVYSIFTEIINPFSTSKTTFFMNNNGVSQAGVFNAYLGGGVHNVATSYDGFTLFPDAGNVTGSVRVYGYKNG